MATIRLGDGDRITASILAYKQEAARHAAKVLDGFTDAEQWHAAHRNCAQYNPIAGTCVHVQEAS